MNDRRSFFARLASLGAGLWAGRKAFAQQQDPHAGHAQPAAPQPGTQSQAPSPGAPGVTVASEATTQRGPAENLPVEFPDLKKLPYTVVDGVKEFHLIAEVIRTEFMPGRNAVAWGYNGSVPGPAIEVQEGDRVRIIFDNHLPEPTTPHWHGLEVPIAMDGVPGVTQDPILPGGRFVYEFTLNQSGTYFYHSHMPMQEMMGMIGPFIIHPKQPHEPRVDRDFGMILQEWGLLANNDVPNTLAMEFNWLTMNGKAGPAITPMLVKLGERVRIRLINLGMDHHPIHLHGVQFVVTGTEGGRQPESTWGPGNTVVVGVAQARDIEFVAKYPGDWMLHCHMPHHNMNQMVSMVGPVMSMGHGLEAGGGMQEGMGIVRQGNALSGDLGPFLGRGLGMAADSERPTSNLVGPAVPAESAVPAPSPAPPTAQEHQGHEGHAVDAVTEMYPKDDPEKKKVPGYPQDMWMVMDEMFKNKPETSGLRRGWTGGMMGMMTLVRVLPPEKYDEIMALVREKELQSSGEQKPASHVLLGRVEAVSESTGRLTVNHGNVEGWMNAMTMAYPVDKPETVTNVKAGDQIRATVYDGDLTLYNVEVVPPGAQR
jgi:FtsP/CotA-like multicopper oxidase with cupredoxin domain/Cu/Ag efflux protein CusF